MNAPSQIMKPQNWQDFETLCKMLWDRIWDCSGTIVKNGRPGQNQCGVDIYANVEKYGGFCGIQCKKKDDNSNSTLTEKEIDAEIAEARKFEPKLKKFIIATTANKDAKIETYIRKRSIESIQQGEFEIILLSWEDIAGFLCQYQNVYKWYLNNCYFDSTGVRVTFNGKDNITIHPQYVKTTVKYILKQKIDIVDNNDFHALNASLFDISQQFAKAQEILDSIKRSQDILDGKRKYDERWCTVEFELENSGDTVVRNMKMYIWFKNETIRKISDRFHYLNDWRIESAIAAQVNSQKDSCREVFKEYQNAIEYRPKNTVFVQGDKTHFKIGLLPADGVTIIPVYWELLSEDYSDKGELTIKVEPLYEEETKIIEVDVPQDLKDDEIEIKPKVVIE